MTDITSGNQFNDDALQEAYQGTGKAAMAAMILLWEILKKALNKNKIEVTKDNPQPDLTVEKNGNEIPDLTVEQNGDRPFDLTIERNGKTQTIDEVIDETKNPKKTIVDPEFQNKYDEEFTQPSTKKKPELEDPNLDSLEDESSSSKRDNPVEQLGTQPSVLFGKVDGKFVNTLDDKQAKAIADIIAAPPGTQIPGAEGLTIRYKGVIIAQTNDKGIVETNTVHDKISEKDIQMLQDTIKPANPIGLNKAVQEQKESATKVTPLESLGIAQPVAAADATHPVSEVITPNPAIPQRPAPPIKKNEDLGEDLGDMPVEETGYAEPPDDIKGRFQEKIKPPAPKFPELRDGNSADRIENIQKENIEVPGMSALASSVVSQAPSNIEQIGKFNKSDIEGSSTREVKDQSKDKIADIANWIEQNTSKEKPDLLMDSGNKISVKEMPDGVKTYSIFNPETVGHAGVKPLFSAALLPSETNNNRLVILDYDIKGLDADYQVIKRDTKELKESAILAAANEPATATPENLSNLQQLVEKEAVPRMDGDTFTRERDGVQTKVENQGENRKVSLTDMENPSAPLSFTYNSKTNDIVSVESDTMTPAIAKEVKTLETFLEQSKVVTVPATDEVKKANGAAQANDNKLNDEIENKVSVGLQSDEPNEPPKPVITSNFIPEPGASQQIVASGQPTPTKPTPAQTSLVAQSKAVIDRLSKQEGHTVTNYENLQLSSKEKEGSIKYDVSDTKSQARLSFTADSKTGNVTEIQEFQSEKLKPKMDKLEKDNSLKEDPNYNNIVKSNSQQISEMASVTNTQSKLDNFMSANLKEDKVPEIGGKPLVPGKQQTAKPLTGGVARRKPAGMTQGG